MTKDEFIEVLKKGPKSSNIVISRGVCSEFVRFKLDKDHDNATIIVDRDPDNQVIYGAIGNDYEVEIPIMKGQGKRWAALARRTIRDIGPILCK